MQNKQIKNFELRFLLTDVYVCVCVLWVRLDVCVCLSMFATTTQSIPVKCLTPQPPQCPLPPMCSGFVVHTWRVGINSLSILFSLSNPIFLSASIPCKSYISIHIFSLQILYFYPHLSLSNYIFLSTSIPFKSYISIHIYPFQIIYFYPYISLSNPIFLSTSIPFKSYISIHIYPFQIQYFYLHLSLSVHVSINNLSRFLIIFLCNIYLCFCSSLYCLYIKL